MVALIGRLHLQPRCIQGGEYLQRSECAVKCLEIVRRVLEELYDHRVQAADRDAQVTERIRRLAPILFI